MNKVQAIFGQARDGVAAQRKALFVALFAVLVGGAALAGGGIELDASGIATTAVTNLTGLLADAAPWIAGAIGASILLRWVRRVFGF